ncbi:hypothetical protein N7490_006101 [Penicillium lividum]|nr:hypothetical protein N7490_006101 [Penicillium lividum]
MFRSVITLLFAATTFAQTPPGSYAHTKHALGAAYQNATITSGIWISPNDVGDQPAIWPATKEMRKDTKYILFMMDLNIPDSDVTTTAYYDTLVPGLAPNTTTRLHWWGGNFTIEDGK